MGLLPDTSNCRLPMHRECRESFPRHRLQKKLLVNDPRMHHATSRTCRDACRNRKPAVMGKKFPAIPGVYATISFTYLVWGPCSGVRVWYETCFVSTTYNVFSDIHVWRCYAVCSIIPSLHFNPLRAKFFRGNINIYLHFMSLRHIDMTEVLKILPKLRAGPTYST